MRTCFFIGHRDAPESLRSQLDEAIERHIMEYGVTDFIVGKYGNFDRMAAQTVQRAKQRYTNIRLTLLLAYYDPIQQSNLPPGFDGSLYPRWIGKCSKTLCNRPRQSVHGSTQRVFACL